MGSQVDLAEGTLANEPAKGVVADRLKLLFGEVAAREETESAAQSERKETR